jgi:hypothetical protein
MPALGGERADGVGVVGAIGDRRRAGLEALHEGRGDRRVIGVAGGQLQPDRPAVGVDEGMDPGRQPAPGASHAAITDIGSPFDGGAVLVHPHAGRVDHHDGAVVGGRHRREQAILACPLESGPP